MKVIYFYEPTTQYYEFSNFYPSVVLLHIDRNTVVASTVENAFQASKFIGPGAGNNHLAYAKLIAGASTPYKAFCLGRQKFVVKDHPDKDEINTLVSSSLNAKIKPRKDWDTVKVSIMKELLLQKFKQIELKELLLRTEECEIVENSPRDSFWGRYNGVGENMLGKLLMEVRKELKDL